MRADRLRSVCGRDDGGTTAAVSPWARAGPPAHHCGGSGSSGRHHGPLPALSPRGAAGARTGFRGPPGSQRVAGQVAASRGDEPAAVLCQAPGSGRAALSLRSEGRGASCSEGRARTHRAPTRAAHLPCPCRAKGTPPGRGNRLSGRPQATRGAARGRGFKSTRREGAGEAAWGPEPPETRPAPGRQGRRAAGSVAQWARRLHGFRRSVAGFCLKDVPGDHRHLIYF